MNDIPKQTQSADLQVVTYHRVDSVAEIGLNRPHVLNALNGQLDNDLMAAFTAAATDKDVRAVLLYGHGRAFCAGADLKERANGPALQVEQIMEEVRRGFVFLRLWELDLPVVGAIHGYCLAGGFHLAMMCDLLIAADTTRFGEPEIRFANPLLVPALPFSVGHKQVREALYSGDTITAARAHELGLVNQLVPDSDLLPVARQRALRLAQLPAEAMQAQKRALRFAAERRGFARAVRANTEILALTLTLQTQQSDGAAAEFLQTARTDGLKQAVQQRDAAFGPSTDDTSPVQMPATEKAHETDTSYQKPSRGIGSPGSPQEASEIMRGDTTSDTTSQTVIYQEHPEGLVGVVQITLNRPTTLNAFNRAMCHDLDSALDRAAELPGLRAVILCGSGRAFSSGMDLKEPDEEPMSEAFLRRHFNGLLNRCLKIWGFPVPVIAAVQGYALGHACDLVAACDYTIAAEGARFGVPEIRHGGGVAALFYPYCMSPRDVRDMLLTGALIEADAACRAGLVTHVVPADQLDTEARTLAATLTQVPPDALRQMKRAVNRAYDMMGLRETLSYNLESLIVAHLAQSPTHWASVQENIDAQGVAGFARQRDQPFSSESG